MAIEKQNFSISFGQGLDTKTDPRQVIPGKLEVLQNSHFVSGNELTKRNGNQQLAANATGVGRSCSAYNDELVSFDNTNLYDYQSANATTLSKGYSQPIDIATQFVLQPPPNGIKATGNPIDIAINGGYTLYTYNGTFYSIIDTATGNVLVAPTSITNTSADTNNVAVKAFALGVYFVMTYVNRTAGLIEYVAIPIATITTPNSAVSIDTINGVAASSATIYAYDGVVNAASSKLYLSYGRGSSQIRTLIITSALAISTSQTTTIANDPRTIAIWLDEFPTTPNVWIAYYDATAGNIRYYVLTATTLSSFLALTTVGTVATVTNIVGITIGGAGHLSALYYEREPTALKQTIQYASLTDAGVVDAAHLFQLNGSLISKPWQVGGNTSYNYIVVGYIPLATTQATYFVMNHHVYNSGFLNTSAPNVAAKLSSGNAQPYIDYNNAVRTCFFVCSVASLSSTKFEFPLSRATTLTTVNGNVFSQYSIIKNVIDFSNNNSYQFQTLASVLNYTGGYLQMYDGEFPVENNFHLSPLLPILNQGTGGSMDPSQTYQYVAVYRWTDSKGNIHRTSSPVNGQAIGSDTQITVTVNCLNFTEKANGTVWIDIFRNTPTGPSGGPTNVFYKVNNLTANVTGSTTTTDTVNYVDQAADATIIGNEILYTNGGIVQDTGGPPCSGITTYQSRLWVIDAEDRNLLWFSKQVLETTSVEMSADFTYSVDPRFGDCTAISVLDDKLIMFKNNAMFYLTGAGPDNTGANDDFSDATLISSNCGCVDPRSVVIMQDGLMLKSNKGIWLLDRGLGLSYIGASVEAFNASHVTGGELIANSTQVQFTLDDSTTCLMYDYFYKQWSVYLNHNAVGCTVYENLFTYIDPSGHIFQENPGVYSDNGIPIYQSLTTSWLSLSGLQGYQRIYRLFFLAKYLSAHSVTFGIAYNFNTAIAQTVPFDATALNASTGTDVEQCQVNIDLQKCQAIQITITETADSNNTIGAGLNIEALGVLIGSKLTYPKLPAVQSVTS